MSPLVQQLVVHASVALAAGWLLLRWRRRRSAPSCSRCGPSSEAAPPGRGVRPSSLKVLR